MNAGIYTTVWLWVVGCWYLVVGRFVWKTIPSEARVTRDAVSGLKQRREELSGRQYLAGVCSSHFLYVLVLSSRQLFLLFFISRDFVPGYSRYARYWLPAKATYNRQPLTNNQRPPTYHYIFLFIDILFLNKITKQLDNSSSTPRYLPPFPGG